MKHKIICGDTLEVLKTLSDECIDCVVTSPPYWGLRSYLPEDHSDKKKEIGLEPTLDLYLDHLIEVVQELKRVLKKTGVIFWNHGDCYGGSGAGAWKNPPEVLNSKENYHLPYESNPRRRSEGRQVKTKCLALQNFRFVARCVDELGLILRNVIIWYKPNHKPESVKDRFTNTYEPVFMLVKNKNYWFDLDAVRVPHKETSKKRVLRAVSNKHKYLNHPEYGGGGRINKPRPNAKRKVSVTFSDLLDKSKKYHREQNMAISQYQYAEGDYLVVNLHPLGANPGDVWSISHSSFSGMHFATFPEKLIFPLIRTGSRAGDTVLDPFGGRGTVGVVAEKLGRNSILIDLNRDYCEMAYQELKSVVTQTRLFEKPSTIERIGF